MTEPKKLTASMEKRFARAKASLAAKGQDAAVTYLSAAFSDVQSLNRLIFHSDASFRPVVEAAKAKILSNQALKAEKNSAMNALRSIEAEKRMIAEDRRLGEIRQSLDTPFPHLRVRFLCALSADDRKIFATKDEMKECITLRKACITTSLAVEKLASTKHEFERWVLQGLLKPVFMKKISMGKMVNARFWCPVELDEFKIQMPTIRTAWDVSKKISRSRKISPVSSEDNATTC